MHLPCSNPQRVVPCAQRQTGLAVPSQRLKTLVLSGVGSTWGFHAFSASVAAPSLWPAPLRSYPLSLPQPLTLFVALFQKSVAGACRWMQTLLCLLRVCLRVQGRVRPSAVPQIVAESVLPAAQSQHLLSQHCGSSYPALGRPSFLWISGYSVAL